MEQASRLLGRGRLCQFVCLSRTRRSKAQDGAPLRVIPTEETLVTERLATAELKAKPGGICGAG